VTIIVLLILAGTTIATLFGENGIINKAQKAKDETEKAQEETEKQLSIDDISSTNKNTPETDEDIEEIQGNATIYISLLKLKLDDMYRQYGIPDEEYNKMKSWLDHIAISILYMKVTISLITDLSSKMNEKLGN